MRSVLITLWQNILQRDVIGSDEDFFELGGDSLSALQLVIDIENATGARLSPDALFAAPTIGRLVELISDNQSAWRPRLIPLQPNGSRPPFFLLYGGPLFRELATGLGEDQPFLTVCLPRLDELPPLPSLEEIARQHAETILAACPEGSYFIGGWCIAGVVAYEIAQQLRERGRAPALLVLFDTINPDLVRNLPYREAFRDQMRFHFDELHRTSWPQLPAYFWQRVRWLTSRLRRWSWRKGVRLRSDRGPVWRNTEEVVYMAGEDYHPRAYEGPVALFRGGKRRTRRYRDPRFGWRKEMVPDLKVYDAAAGHREMFMQPYVRETANQLGACFFQASEKEEVRTESSVIQG